MWKNAEVELLIRALAYLVGYHLYANRGNETRMIRGHMLRITAAYHLVAWLLTWRESEKTVPPYIEGDEKTLARTAVNELLRLGSFGPETISLQLGFGMSYLDKLSQPALAPEVPPLILTFYWGAQLMQLAVDANDSVEKIAWLLQHEHDLLSHLHIAFANHELGRSEFHAARDLTDELTNAAKFARSFPDVNDNVAQRAKLCAQPPFEMAALQRLSELIG